jgi:flagellar hook-associated protein 3 FlgL
VNRTGPDVFGTADGADPLNGDVFQMLEQLAVAVSNGDSATMGLGLTLVDGAIRRVDQAQVAIGSVGKQLDGLLTNLEDSKVSVQESLTKLEDIDLAEAIVNMKTREAAYQAAIQVTARVIQPTLLDFIR